jgi:hypothetical protein
MLKLAGLLAVATLTAAPSASSLGAIAEEPVPVFELPVDCTVGKDCFVQQYFDHDPAATASDYNCGNRSYDGHDGTDFRLPSLAAQRAGVRVLAAASGVVYSVRNDMPDQSFSDVNAAAVSGRECGNGVVVNHEGGWTSQYCHMAKGSLSVAAGDLVESGQPLGNVGLSGMTQFPHLHFAVRNGDNKLDPFSRGDNAAECKAQKGLWSAKAAALLTYRHSEIINAGFAAAALEMDDIEQQNIVAPTAGSMGLVFYARAIGLRKDDMFVIDIVRPDGSMLSHDETFLQSDFAQRFGYAGKKRPAGGWMQGKYRATCKIVRRGKTIAAHDAAITI